MSNLSVASANALARALTWKLHLRSSQLSSGCWARSFEWIGLLVVLQARLLETAFSMAFSVRNSSDTRLNFCSHFNKFLALFVKKMPHSDSWSSGNTEVFAYRVKATVIMVKPARAAFLWSISLACSIAPKGRENKKAFERQSIFDTECTVPLGTFGLCNAD